MTAASDTQPVVTIRSLVYAWPGQSPVIDIPELTLAKGERMFLAGPSGSGKSTLLGLIGGVAVPDSGDIEVLGTSLTGLSVAERDRQRSDYVDSYSSFSICCRT